MVTLLSLALLSMPPSLPAPDPHPLCLEEPPVKEVKEEHVHSTWPDGSVKAKQVNFTDGTYVQLQYHENGQVKYESYHTKVLIDGDPRRRRHVKHGTERRWQEDGTLFVCAVHVEGKKDGTWIYYDRDGNPASAFTYEDDKEVEHLTYSRVFGWQPFK